MDRQCPSCGGFCKKSGCERENTTPKREWVGLTDNEIETIVNNNTHDDCGYDIWCHGKGVARDIEAKLKEKNT